MSTDPARQIADHLTAAGHPAAVHLPATFMDDLPVILVEVVTPQRNDLFAADTIALTAYAPGRTTALSTVRDALADVEGRSLFDPAYGLIDRVSSVQSPMPVPFTDSVTTATARVLAEYRP